MEQFNILYQAITENPAEFASLLRDRLGCIDRVNSKGRTLLMRAVKTKSLPIVQTILDHLPPPKTPHILKSDTVIDSSVFAWAMDESMITILCQPLIEEDMIDAWNEYSHNLIQMALHQNNRLLLQIGLKLVATLSVTRQYNMAINVGEYLYQPMILTLSKSEFEFKMILNWMNSIYPGFGHDMLLYDPEWNLHPLQIACDGVENNSTMIRAVFQELTIAFGSDMAKTEFDLTYGQKLDSDPRFDLTPRQTAISSGNIDHMRTIFELTGTPFFCGRYPDLNFTSLLHCASNPNARKIYDFEPEFEDSPETTSQLHPLLAMMQWGWGEFGDVDAVDANGFHPLWSALYYDDMEAIQMLKAIRDQSISLPAIPNTPVRRLLEKKYYTILSSEEVLSTRFTVYFSISLVERCLHWIRD